MPTPSTWRATGSPAASRSPPKQSGRIALRLLKTELLRERIEQKSVVARKLALVPLPTLFHLSQPFRFQFSSTQKSCTAAFRTDPQWLFIPQIFLLSHKVYRAAKQHLKISVSKREQCNPVIYLGNLLRL